jgi:hypothetical protein
MIIEGFRLRRAIEPSVSSTAAKNYGGRQACMRSQRHGQQAEGRTFPMHELNAKEHVRNSGAKWGKIIAIGRYNTDQISTLHCAFHLSGSGRIACRHVLAFQ